jgi:hypothetical protein
VAVLTDPAVGLRAGSIVDSHLVPGRRQVTGHRRAHHAEAEECHTCHAQVLLGWFIGFDIALRAASPGRRRQPRVGDRRIDLDRRDSAGRSRKPNAMGDPRHPEHLAQLVRADPTPAVGASHVSQPWLLPR